jgi:hypothetical protein
MAANHVPRQEDLKPQIVGWVLSLFRIPFTKWHLDLTCDDHQIKLDLWREK